jgi:hypothetical protein
MEDSISKAFSIYGVICVLIVVMIVIWAIMGAIFDFLLPG